MLSAVAPAIRALATRASWASFAWTTQPHQQRCSGGMPRLLLPPGVELKVEGKKGDPGPAPGLQDPATEVGNVDNKADGSVGDATVSIGQDRH